MACSGQAPAALLREWTIECGRPAGLANAKAFNRIVSTVGLTVEGLVEAQ